MNAISSDFSERSIEEDQQIAIKWMGDAYMVSSEDKDALGVGS